MTILSKNSLFLQEKSLMIAVEEKDLQSVKTDASLYNGHPPDTGTQCHNVGVTSSTPSILINKDGVSVESVHTHS